MNSNKNTPCVGRRLSPWLVVIVAYATLGGAQGAAPSADTTADSRFVPAGYQRVFSDDFNAARLDTTRWWTRYIYNDGKLDTLNDERQRFREDGNHIMTGSTLELMAYKAPTENPRFQYESGMIRSKDTFKYGYYEARIKMPGGLGVWPAFWLNSDASPEGVTQWPPEIDIFEFAYNGKDDRINMIHFGAVTRAKDGVNPWGGEDLFRDERVDSKWHNYHAPFDFPADYHVFGLLWDTNDTITWFVDGKKLCTKSYKWVCKDGKDAPYAHVLLNLSIGGSWAGRYGIDDNAFPQSLSIDYVRVYQKPDHKRVGRSTIGHDLLPEKSVLRAPLTIKGQQGHSSRKVRNSPHNKVDLAHPRFIG